MQIGSYTLEPSILDLRYMTLDSCTLNIWLGDVSLETIGYNSFFIVKDYDIAGDAECMELRLHPSPLQSSVYSCAFVY